MSKPTPATRQSILAFVALMLAAQALPTMAIAEAGSTTTTDVPDLGLASFRITLDTDAPLANVPFHLTATALDATGATLTTYHEGTQVSGDGITVRPHAISGAQWQNGVATVPVTISGPLGSHELTLRHGQRGETSVHFQLLAGHLATITITGPDSLAAGSSATYALAGHDAAGNPITLGQTQLEYTAPTTVGPATVTYSEQGITGTKPILVTTGALASLAVDPARACTSPGGVLTFHAIATDAYGNHAMITPDSWTSSLGTIDAAGVYTAHALGDDVITATRGGLTGTASTHVLAACVALSGQTTGVTPTVAQSFTNGIPVWTYSVRFDRVEAGATIELTPPAGAPGDPSLRHITIVLEGDATNLELQIQLQPGSLLATPSEVDAADLAAQLGTSQVDAPVIFITVLALVDGTQLTPTQLNALIGHIDLSFDIPATYFTTSDLDPARVAFIEYSAGHLVTNALAATLVPPTPDGAVYHYTTTFDQFSSFAFLARHPLPTTPGGGSGGSGSGGSGSGGSGSGGSGGSGGNGIGDVIGPLARVIVSGPDTMMAGTTAIFSAAGFDAAGHSVSIPSPTFSWTAPTRAGFSAACIVENGVTGCKAVTVIAGALVSVSCTGPPTAFAGTQVIFTCVGRDAAGNTIPLVDGKLTVTAPNTPGVTTACLTETGIQGCATYTVFAGCPGCIIISPDHATVAVGETLRFIATGYDASGAPTAMAVTWTTTCGSIAADGTYTAPLEIGPCLITATNAAGKAAQVAVDVVAGRATSLNIDGPDFIIAGAPAQFTAIGVDAHGNQFNLQDGEFTITANQKVGPQDVCRTIGDAKGCKTVTVIPAALARLEIVCPPEVNTGEVFSCETHGYDAFGNEVTLSGLESTKTNQFATPGSHQVCYSEAGVAKCTDVKVVALKQASVGPTTPGGAPPGTAAWWQDTTVLVIGTFALTSMVAAGILGIQKNWFRRKQ